MLEIIPEIILASQSKPRKQLLEKLKIDFSTIPANIDETPFNQEPIDKLVERLSKSKANTVLEQILISQPNKNFIIISSDQVAVHNNMIYGKPGDYNGAVKQLSEFNDNTIEFLTGLCVIYYQHESHSKKLIYTSESSKIKLRKLSLEQIKNYINKEQPYSCAASFKIEGLGISLVESIDTGDFNAIIGLPMIKLINILNDLKVDILSI